jgi:hypothetical protein
LGSEYAVMPRGRPVMNSAMNRVIEIFLIGWLVHVPGTLPGDATNRAPVKFALRDAVADRPVVRKPREKGRDTTRGTQTPQGQAQGQDRNPARAAGETAMEEFVPSEEIKAGQAVDFPADI